MGVAVTSAESCFLPMLRSRDIGHHGEALLPAKRTLSRSLAVSALAVASLAAALMASPAQAAPAPVEPGMYLAFTQTTTFEEAVLQAAQAKGSAVAVATLEAMRATATSGQPLALPGANPATGDGAVGRLDALLAHVRTLPPAASHAQDPSQPPGDTAMRTMSVQAAADPALYPERGYPINGNYSWAGMRFIVEAMRCVSSCSISDRITASNVVTDPGAITSRFNTYLNYFPSQGAFSRTHFQSWALCYGHTQCNWTNSADRNSGPLTWYLSSNRGMNQNYLAHSHTLWTYFGPGGYWVRDNAKTKRAWCFTAPDNRCQY